MRIDNAHIAIIIPVYGVTGFLEVAIESALAQNYQHQEIIVVDDGSDANDSSEIIRICKKFEGVMLLWQEHSGPACARQYGVTNTSADLIVFLDADDIMLPGTLHHFAEIMLGNPAAIATYGRLQNIDSGGIIMADPVRPPAGQMVSGKKLLHALLEKRFLLYNGTVCIRRQALLNLPAQDYTLRLGEDWVLWCHLALSGNIIAASERVVLQYRRHEHNVSGTMLDDPSLVFAAIDTVFNDPLFINSIGEKELQQLYEKCTGRMHAYLAIGYAKRGDSQKSRYHLAKGGKFIRAASDSPIAQKASSG